MESVIINMGIHAETLVEQTRSQHTIIKHYTESRSPEQLIRALIEAHMC